MKTERKYMRKLALSDDVLLSIEKPARYIGAVSYTHLDVYKRQRKVPYKISFEMAASSCI